MDSVRLAPLAGTAFSLIVVGLLLAPYVLLDETATTGLAVYYGQSALGDAFVGLIATFALAGAVAFVGGYRGQTAADLVAGVTLPVGVGIALLVGQWALAVDAGVVASIGTATWLEHHRWSVVVAALAIPASAAWYAMAIFER